MCVPPRDRDCVGTMLGTALGRLLDTTTEQLTASVIAIAERIDDGRRYRLRIAGKQHPHCAGPSPDDGNDGAASKGLLSKATPDVADARMTIMLRIEPR